MNKRVWYIIGALICVVLAGACFVQMVDYIQKLNLNDPQIVSNIGYTIVYFLCGQAWGSIGAFCALQALWGEV